MYWEIRNEENNSHAKREEEITSSKGATANNPEF
jgi:hypothetical protein